MSQSPAQNPEEMPSQYDPTHAEERWYPIWEEKGYFKPEVNPDGEPYTIVIPPPNVTGSLHMGHALTVTIEDSLIRWRRMQGRKTLWLPGVDHAGIATQVMVERQLKTEGTDRHQLGREKFLERVWAWKEQYGNRISDQLRVMGCSLDWSRERFTMDEALSKAVREVFVQLHEEGLIHRSERLINWCPVSHTALSDLEVEHQDTQGELYHFAYPYADGSGELVVATTRPETMLGDTAVAVHPDDERYQDIIGKTLKHPLLGYEIPVVGDAVLVDPEFGTGAVKVTPAHDFNDFETGKRHHLVLFNIFDRDAKVLEAPEIKKPATGEVGPCSPEAIAEAIDHKAWARFAGMDRFDARKAVKAALAEMGLEKESKPHAMAVGRSQRSGAVVEPALSTQWFVKTESLAKPAIEAVKSGETKIIPETWNKTYFHWMENIQDWCISRQLWWGHRIPAWYVVDADHNPDQPIPSGTEAHVGLEPPELEIPAGKKLVQDPDVLDTWFSSGLWPFSTLGWPDKSQDLEDFYPNTVMETGFDILFFWVARMMMMGCKFMGKPPFPTIYLHAMVRDKLGDKMSKTKGNVIDPLDLVHGCNGDDVSEQFKKDYPKGFPAFGADAVRFTLAAMSASGRDIKLSVERIAGYRAFANKIWNAARFVLMRLEGAKPAAIADIKDSLEPADRYILDQLHRATAAVDSAMEAFRFADAANAIYQFFWAEFCDWYIELVKGRLLAEGTDEDTLASKAKAQATLVHTLDQALRLLHPMMPFITEEIWQRLPLADQSQNSIMVSAYPMPRDTEVFADSAVEAEYRLVKDAIGGVRTVRSESNVAPSKKIAATLYVPEKADRDMLESHRQELMLLARLETLTIEAPSDARPKQAGVKVCERFEVIVPLAGLVDFAKEVDRLEKAIGKAEKEHDKLSKKLGNENYVARAPKDVVAADRERVDELSTMLQTLAGSLKRAQEALAEG